MPEVVEQISQRLEGMALGQYLAVRSILFAVISTVIFALTTFLIGFVFGFSESAGWPEDPSGLIAGIFVGGGVLAVAFLLRSVSAYFEHDAVNRKLLALQPYSSWADAITNRPASRSTPQPQGKGTSDISKDWSERAKIAQDPSTPVDLLVRLAADPMSSVRRNVADNPSTPKRVVDDLAEDADVGVRRAAKRRRRES